MSRGKRVGEDAVQITLRVPGVVAQAAEELVPSLRAKGVRENTELFRATRADVLRLAIRRGLLEISRDLVSQESA